jgi:parallel beta-helix repeat protein
MPQTKPTSEQVTFLQAGTGATQRTALAKLRDTVSVKDFGAVGDGVADDTAAITLAIKSNRKILFPTGTYSVSSSITFSTLTNFEINGNGSDVSIIKYTNAVFTNHGFNFQGCTNFEISGITIDQNSNTSFNNLFAPMRIVSSSNFNIVKNNFINHTYVGLALDSVSNFVVDDNYIAKTTQTNGVNYNLMCHLPLACLFKVELLTID